MNTININRLLSNPEEGSIFKAMSGMTKADAKEFLEKVVTPRLIGIALEEDVDPLTYLLAALGANHLTALDMAEEAGNKIEESDGSDAVKWQIRSEILGTVIENKKGWLKILKRSLVSQPGILSLVSNIGI